MFALIVSDLNTDSAGFFCKHVLWICLCTFTQICLSLELWGVWNCQYLHRQCCSLTQFHFQKNRKQRWLSGASLPKVDHRSAAIFSCSDHTSEWGKQRRFLYNCQRCFPAAENKGYEPMSMSFPAKDMEVGRHKHSCSAQTRYIRHPVFIGVHPHGHLRMLTASTLGHSPHSLPSSANFLTSLSPSPNPVLPSSVCFCCLTSLSATMSHLSLSD